MDIQLTDSLLREYLETPASPRELAEKISLCGPTVDRLHQEGDDWVYDIEVITNRIDAASAIGIAREASAILPEFNIEATLKPYDTSKMQKAIAAKDLQPLDISVMNNPALNTRILAIKIADVEIKPSPQWMQDRLEMMGQRPLNNIIDITNYVMFELGHPVHVFDYDRLTEKKIIVREAKKGEKVVTLDEKVHVMRGGEIVYDDGTGTIIDLPGIMGTANSVVTEQTKNVLLWIEDNNGKKIRYASLLHQIRSHAAQLNEKQVDPELSYASILRSAELMMRWGNGKLGSQLLDIYPEPRNSKVVDLSISWLNEFAGVSISKEQIVSILSRLGFSVTEKSADVLACTVPSWRWHDISLREDLAEEVTRIYGYFRFPSILPQTDIPAIGTNPNLTLEMKMREYMAKLGFTEVYNSSLISQAQLDSLHISGEDVFRLSNPLSEDYIYMRPSLVPSLKQNILNNQVVRLPQLIFELSNIYQKEPQQQLAREQSTLAFAVVGESFRQFKGYLEAIGTFLHLLFTLQSPHMIMVHDQRIGNFEQSESAWIGELNFEQLATLGSLVQHFQQISQFTPIIEDLTFTLPEKKPVGSVIQTIKTIHPLIAQVELKEIYEHNYTFTIFYRAQDRTLTNEEVAPIRKAIVETMMRDQIPLVGSLL